MLKKRIYRQTTLWQFLKANGASQIRQMIAYLRLISFEKMNFFFNKFMIVISDPFKIKILIVSFTLDNFYFYINIKFLSFF